MDSDDSVIIVEAVKQFGKLLECPVCFGKLKPPIRTCDNGHGYCENCSKQMTNCGLCRTKIKGVNTLLNQVIETLGTEDKNESLLGIVSKKLALQCKYSSEGCTKSFTFSSLKDHEKICCYREEKCVICHKEMEFTKLNGHMKNCVKTIQCVTVIQFSEIQVINCLIPKINKKIVSRYLVIYLSEIETYFIVRRMMNSEEKTFFCVQYLGLDQENARNYIYHLKINQGMPAPNKFYFSYSGLCSPYFYDWEDIEQEKGTVQLYFKYIFLTDDYKSQGFDLEIKICKLN